VTVIVPSLIQPVYPDPRVLLYDADYSDLDDPRTVPFRDGVECFICRRPCRIESSCGQFSCEAAFSLWSHNSCVQGKTFAEAASLYYDAVRRILLESVQR